MARSTNSNGRMNAGYFRFPAIRGDTVVFVSEDDLWTAPASGGVARRLTSNLGPVGRGAISPDGSLVAFTGTEEHHLEVYVMEASGGPARRLTFMGAQFQTQVRGWAPDGRIVYVSDAGQPFGNHSYVYAVSPDGGQPERLPVGPAHEISFGPSGGTVIGRHTADLARWKRYKGGTRGDIWIDRNGDGNFKRLIALAANSASPMWIGDRIYFLSDHEGIGNLYSCTLSGGGLRRHTDHGEYYARWASSDGERIVYQHAAELWLYDPSTQESSQIEVDFRSPRIQRNRKFVDAGRYLHAASLHPSGHSLALETRGKLFTMPLWEHAVRQYGRPDGVRYRLPCYNHDGTKVIAVSDEGDTEALEFYSVDDPSARTRLAKLDLGRILQVAASPAADVVAVVNHRHELHVVDLAKKTAVLADQSPYARMSGPAWSPDGRWLAYSYAASDQTRCIRLREQATGKIRDVTRADFFDVAPSFDPGGKYLYFLSARTFNPVYDMLFFDLGFPRSVRPYAITLQADEPSPFLGKPRGFGPDNSKNGAPQNGSAPKKDKRPDVKVDLDGIEDRVVAFPVPEGRYTQVWGIHDKVLLTNYPVTGSLNVDIFNTESEPEGTLECYDLKELKHETLTGGISSFSVSQDGRTLVYRGGGGRLRALKAGDKPDPKQEKERPGRASGWIDLGRVRVSVDPGAEWVQMQHEAWRFQLDHFWVPDMSGVDWDRVYKRYRPLVDKVATRGEFSDLMWEMLGELGTSHAYDMGGDLRQPPPYVVGHLGCDFVVKDGVWRFGHIVNGDSWDPSHNSPLNAPGVNVKEGDRLLAVGGQALDGETPPQALLVSQAGQVVELTVANARGANKRTVVVQTLRDETPARYREWVERNRALVHEATGGRVGYVHIPNMGPKGYSEFHRYYYSELEREALIVDVRFNGGGHVSQLLLEKLARKPIGYNVPRWGKPQPYPSDSPGGPMVCITNERAGSDGDIFTHAFKLLGLGPVVGKRTWGGVIGISMRHTLADNGMTTQPEFSYWFKDVGWGVENYGTDPDYDVDIRPQDHVAGRDPQMEKALQLVQAALRKHRPVAPDMSKRPNLALPVLPDRNGKVAATPKAIRVQAAEAAKQATRAASGNGNGRKAKSAASRRKAKR